MGSVTFNLLYLFTTGNILLLTFLLLLKPSKVNERANNWLSMFLFLLFLIFLNECLRVLGLKKSYLLIEEILSVPLFLIAPSFYLSIQFYIHPKRRIVNRDYLHLLPLLIYLILMGTLLFSQQPEKNVSVRFQDDLISMSLTSLLFSQIIAYVVTSFRDIRKHQKKIQLFASNVESIDLTWLQNIIYGTAFMIILWLLEIMLPAFPDFSTVGYFIAVGYLAYYTLYQKEIYPFEEREIAELSEIIENKSASIKFTPLISDDLLVAEKVRLDGLMNTQKLFLDSELSLPKLAGILNTSTHQLSYLLNTGFSETFYDYVNRYRVEEFKKLLKDKRYQHLSIIGIAYEVGFSSKTTLYASFKKLTGTSPTAYRKQMTD
jgi:AraC-like DNA-binding protein